MEFVMSMIVLVALAIVALVFVPPYLAFRKRKGSRDETELHPVGDDSVNDSEITMRALSGRGAYER